MIQKTNDVRPRNDAGRLVPRYTDSDFIDAVRKLGIAGNTDVAQLVGCDTTTAKRRLFRLAECGLISKTRTSVGWVFTMGKHPVTKK